MSLSQRKYFWGIIWLIIVVTGPITVILNTPLHLLTENQAVLVNFFQRITGLLAYSLLFTQLIIGANMERFVQMVGAKAYRVHITQGLAVYGLALIHPVLYFILTYENIASLLLFFIPQRETIRDIWINFGRIGFALLTISVFAGYFRTKPFFRKNWLKFHVLNYVVFLLIAVHVWFVGSDVKMWPFYGFFVISVAFYLITVAARLLKIVLPVLKNYFIRLDKEYKPKS